MSMYQRRLRDYSQKARCTKHGLYPLNFRYRGASFANSCPVCHPDWRPSLEKMRDDELRKHETDDTTAGEA